VPFFAGVLFEVGAASSAPVESAAGAGFAGFSLVAVVGALAGLALRVPIGALVGPLVLATLAAFAGLPVVVPGVAAAAALAVIGLSVGLSFDAQALRVAGRLLPAMLGGILIVIAGSLVLALALARWAGVDGLTAYLATSPGALNAVLATAYDTGATVTFVIAAQVLRFLVFVVAAPALASRWTPRPEPA
jgi:membrane AbrB-like protein